MLPSKSTLPTDEGFCSASGLPDDMYVDEFLQDQISSIQRTDSSLFQCFQMKNFAQPLDCPIRCIPMSFSTIPNHVGLSSHVRARVAGP